jgi:type II secretory pathway component GspD/PulD (secretin)
MTIPRFCRFIKRAAALVLWSMVVTVGHAAAQDPQAMQLPAMVSQSPKASGPQGLEGLQRHIFLDLRDINVVDVIKFLALEGNLNIVTSKNVQGRSTLLVKDVTIQDALDIIIVSNQLAYDVKKDIIYVMTEEEYQQLYGISFNDKKKVLTRNLKYAKPSYASTALQAIASAIGKVIVDEETGTVIMIDTDDKLKKMDTLLDQIEGRLETKVIKLQYANAKDVETQLRAMLDAKGVGTIFGDVRSNQIVITAYAERMAEILPMVEALDKKTKVVLIEARILQLTINPKYDYGIDWDAFFSQNKMNGAGPLDLRGAFPIDSTLSSQTTLGSVGKIGYGVFGADALAAQVKALKQVSKTNLLANPRLVVLDRQEGKINIGDTIPYVITTSTVTGNNTVKSEDIKFINIGLSLIVSPIIHDDDFVTLTIRPEISSRTGTLVTQEGNQIPIVNASSMESTVEVKNGVTVILGGLRRDDYTEKNKGLAYLMDVPVLGKLFQSRGESIEKTEIVVFLTPKIITGDQNITGEPIGIKGVNRGIGKHASTSVNAFSTPEPVK